MLDFEKQIETSFTLGVRKAPPPPPKVLLDTAAGEFSPAAVAELSLGEGVRGGVRKGGPNMDSHLPPDTAVR